MTKTLTLQQGLEAFHQKNTKYFSTKEVSDIGSQFMKCHDAAHVVFGCDVSIYGEGVVKTWTTFGTDLSLGEILKGYQEVSAFQLFKKYSLKHVIRNIFQLLLAIPKTIYRAEKMSKPWQFLEYEAYLTIPLSEIRKEFNIRVLS